MTKAAPVTNVKFVATTHVPGAQSIGLVDVYEEFLNYYPYCEMQTKRWFVENTKPDWVIFDVGANIGYYSILFSRLAPKGRVTAFEPTTSVVKLLRNLSANDVENVFVEPIALGRRTGMIEDGVYRIWGNAPEREVYQFETVDSYVRRKAVNRLDCIKIDTDSFDFEVLQGARATLERFNPYVVVELNHALSRRDQSAAEALQWLEDCGYREAVVLDFDNFVLKRRDDDSKAGFTLHFDRRPLVRHVGQDRGDAAAGPRFASPSGANGVEIETLDAGWRICGSIPAWGYAALFAPEISARDEIASPDRMIGLDVLVKRGPVGFGLLNRDGSDFIGPVVSVAARTGLQYVNLPWSAEATQLVVRNNDPAEADLDLVVTAVGAYERLQLTDQKGSSLSSSAETSIEIEALREMVDAAAARQAS